MGGFDRGQATVADSLGSRACLACRAAIWAFAASIFEAI